MKELLNEWSSLESRYIVKSNERWEVRLLSSNILSFWISDNKPISPYELACIQFVVQEAIESRGWDWEITCYRNISDGICYSSIVSIPSEFEIETFSNIDYTSAASLLSTYLEVLKSRLGDVQKDYSVSALDKAIVSQIEAEDTEITP